MSNKVKELNRAVYTLLSQPGDGQMVKAFIERQITKATLSKDKNGRCDEHSTLYELGKRDALAGLLSMAQHGERNE